MDIEDWNSVSDWSFADASRKVRSKSVLQGRGCISFWHGRRLPYVVKEHFYDEASGFGMMGR